MDCDEHIERALELAESLLAFSNADRSGCEHDGCLLLDGIVRDSTLRIRQVALRWREELQREAMDQRGSRN